MSKTGNGVRQNPSCRMLRDEATDWLEKAKKGEILTRFARRLSTYPVTAVPFRPTRVLQARGREAGEG